MAFFVVVIFPATERRFRLALSLPLPSVIFVYSRQKSNPKKDKDDNCNCILKFYRTVLDTKSYLTTTSKHQKIKEKPFVAHLP